MPPADSPRTDRLLLLEVLLGLVLGGMALYFYIVPSESETFSPRWWVGFALAILFFSIVILETLRRRARARAEMHGVLDRTSRDEEDAVDS